MSLLSILGVVFVVLKLTAVIDWSWFWVLSPFIASAVLWILAILFLVWGEGRR